MTRGILRCLRYLVAVLLGVLLVELSLQALEGFAVGVRGARAGPPDGSGNLLAGKAPVKVHGVAHARVLTDGTAAVDGDIWKSDVAARFGDSNSFVEYDLGKPELISAIWLHGDNNDQYHVWVSADGERFDRAWRAPEVRQPGLQPRFATGLGATGRYVRISASGGDHAQAISEVMIFGHNPETFPPEVPRQAGASVDRLFRDRTLTFGFFLILGVLAARRDGARWFTALLLLVMLGAGYVWYRSMREAWPVLGVEISLVRGVAATVAFVAVLRDCFSPPRHPPHRGVVLGVLSVCAVGSFLAFYNLGHPQFYDEGRQTWTFGHFLDLRQYYPTAKYFDELGYRGIYEADALAYAEEKGLRLDQIDRLGMRDLHGFGDSIVAHERERIDARRELFSEERWREYRADARYFRGAMGERGYLETLRDYGGNATPVWMGIAHLLFNAVPPSNLAFTLTGLIDTALLLLALGAIAWTFGVRSALVCAVIFGANDFIMYGTNWGGATLRHDWLAYLGFGAVALRREKWFFGGALIGFSVMIRAFPLLAVLGIAVPLGWWIAEYAWKRRRLPRLRVLLQNNVASVRVLAGAALAMAILFVFSLLILPEDSWREWYSKVTQLQAEPHPATAGWRTLLGGSTHEQSAVLRSRLPVFIGVLVGYLGLAIVAARRKRPEEAALLGLMLLPVVFTPAIYYIHVLFLFPLVVSERRPLALDRSPLSTTGALVWLVLLGLCAAQYPTVAVADFPLHFYLANTLLLVATAALLAILARDAAWGWLTTPPGASLATSPRTDEAGSRESEESPEAPAFEQSSSSEAAGSGAKRD